MQLLGHPCRRCSRRAFSIAVAACAEDAQQINARRERHLCDVVLKIGDRSAVPD